MRIQVFLGTGGVGKTSVAAASALREALAGSKCLVVTIDPAMRLRTALGLEPGGLEQRVSLDPSAKGELWAALLDVRASLDRAVLRYGKPDEAKTVLEHPIYQMLAGSLVGMQELMAIERIHQAVEDGFTSIFIDTAPSRHALEFLDKPEYFTRLVSFPFVKLVGRTYKWWINSPIARIGKSSFELYTRVEEMLGANLVHQVLDFFSVFRKFAEGYADRAKETLSLLRDPGTTSFSIVTTPSKAMRDGEHFLTELTQRKFPVGSLVVNRIWPEFRRDLPPDPPPQVQGMIGWYEDVCQSHQRIRDQVARTFTGKIPRLVTLPELAGDLDGLEALHQMVERLDSSSGPR